MHNELKLFETEACEMQGVCLLSSLACSDTVLVQESSVGSPGTCGKDVDGENSIPGCSIFIGDPNSLRAPLR